MVIVSATRQVWSFQQDIVLLVLSIVTQREALTQRGYVNAMLITSGVMLSKPAYAIHLFLPIKQAVVLASSVYLQMTLTSMARLSRESAIAKMDGHLSVQPMEAAVLAILQKSFKMEFVLVAPSMKILLESLMAAMAVFVIINIFGTEKLQKVAFVMQLCLQ